MKEVKTERDPSVKRALTLFLLSGATVVIGAVVWKEQIPLSFSDARWLGLVFVALGILIVVLAARSAGRAFQGSIEPILPELVTHGPYQLVRHPVYLGFTLALIGVALASRSYVALAAVAIAFFPSVVYRAKVEERVLAQKFGKSWEDYVQKTYFLLPGIW